MDVPMLERPFQLREWRFEKDRLVDRDGRTYPYDSIAHMGMIHQTIKRNAITVKSDGIVTFIFSGGETLEVNTLDRLPRVDDERNTEIVLNIWKVLSEATLPQRMKPYIDQYMAEGYFDFGGLAPGALAARFFRGGKVEQGERWANIKTDKYSIGNGYFRAHVPGKTVFEELRKTSGEKDITVSTVIDGDAFYTLIPIILSS